MKITNTIILLFAGIALFGQVRVEQIEINASATQAILLGTSQEVRDIVASGSDFRAKKEIFRRNKKKPDNFIGRLQGQSKAIIPELEHLGDDPIRQSEHSQNNIIEPLININGIGDFGSPMDPTGDVGLEHYVQAVNVTQVGVFDKEANLIQEFAMSDLWAPLGESSAGDPIVLFDDVENRWFITEFTDPANLLIAVSVTSDPLGSYHAYSFSTPEFPDYPKYGIWPEALVVTSNEGDAGILHQYFIDKAAIIAGEPMATIQRVEIPGGSPESGFLVSTPVDVDGFRFDIDWDDVNNTTAENISIPTTNFDGFPCSAVGFGFSCIPQLNGSGVDGLPEVIMNIPKFRQFGTHESVVLSFITDVTDGDNHSGIRWVELRKTPGSEWTLYQEGTYAPDELDRFMPSIAIDKFGNIGLGYNVSSPNDNVGVRYTGRFASDPLGEMTITEYNVVDGQAAINANGRFGDYAQMSVDPINGVTFWFTTEYAGNGTFVTETRIVAFELGRDTFDLGVISLVEPTNSASLTNAETVTIKVQNTGLEAIANYDVGFFFDGILTDQITIADTLPVDSTRLHSFTNTVDMSALGAYEIKAFISHPLDSTFRNDTLLAVVNQLLAIDGVLTLEQPMNTCTPDFEVSAIINNNGVDDIVSGEFHITLNGTPIDTVSWAGNLSFGQSESLTIPISGLTVDANNIEIVFTNVNGSTDQDNTNNTAQTTVNFDGNLTQFTLNILTDDYPGETTWEVADPNNTVLFSGGPFSGTSELNTIDMCLDTAQCYTFTIFDSYGDGICCGVGVGNYNMTDAQGNIVFSDDGQFASQETQNFCGRTMECLLTATFMIAQDENGTNNGSIIVEATGGTPPLMYSIDGGNTFQSSPTFDNLMYGEYPVVVQDATDNCAYSETVSVPLFTSTVGVAEYQYSFILRPNPNDGYFTIEFSIEDAPPVLDFEIIDINGRAVQSRMMGSYDGVFIAPVSLVAYPAGTYFVRVFGEEFSVLRRVVKQ